MPTGDYNANSSDAMFAMILSELAAIKELVAPLPELKQKMAQLTDACPALGGSGACQSQSEEKKTGSPNWLKWLLVIAVLVGTALGWIPK